MLLRRLMLNNKEIDNMRILGVKHYYNISTIYENSFIFSAPASGKTSLVEINYIYSSDSEAYPGSLHKTGYIIGNGEYIGYTRNSSAYDITVTVSGTKVTFSDYNAYYADLQFIVYEVEI